jgi:hypothetical protein
MPPRPDVAASYAIPVRRARTLLTASFRFRVAPDTLAVRLTVPTIRVRRGLAPPSHQSATTADWMALARHAPCLAHIQKSPALLRGFFRLFLSVQNRLVKPRLKVISGAVATAMSSETPMSSRYSPGSFNAPPPTSITDAFESSASVLL